jgi:hypothetical protein
MTAFIGRREFITLLGGAAAWPLGARAQTPKMLRVGYSGILPHGAPHYLAFEKRMAELGYQRGVISRSSTSSLRASMGTS